MRKIIISLAPVGPASLTGVQNPLTPEQVAEEVIACERAGAALVHLHVRDARGEPTCELAAFRQTLDLIRRESSIILEGSTGGVGGLSVEQRCAALDDERVEMASLNMGSVNFEDGVYVNTLPDIRYWAQRMRNAQVLAELEVFEAGMIETAKALYREGVLPEPLVCAFCVGFHWALGPSADSLLLLKNLLPDGARWGMMHHGMEDMSLLAAAVGMGASFIRVGFEDSTLLGAGRQAERNVDLVGRAVDLVAAMGQDVASASEAREMLNLRAV